MGWIEACRLVEEFSDWQPEEGEEDQVMVDYLWTLCVCTDDDSLSHCSEACII